MGLHNYEYTTGPRTHHGAYPYQIFTAEHCGDGSDNYFCDYDATSLVDDHLVIVEDKKKGHPCSTCQLINLQITDLLMKAGQSATGGNLSFTVYGEPYQVTWTYDGLLFATDASNDGVSVTYTGATSAKWVYDQGEHYSIDTIVRNREGAFMLVIRSLKDERIPEGKAKIAKAMHELIKAGMEATGGRVHPDAAKFPLNLTYHGLHLFEHDNAEDIAAGKMWWDGKQQDLEGIKRAFDFNL